VSRKKDAALYRRSAIKTVTNCVNKEAKMPYLVPLRQLLSFFQTDQYLSYIKKIFNCNISINR
ncbi:uncharacterized protein METZ01_LOCUS210083, partial [marine metagenome]